MTKTGKELFILILFLLKKTIKPYILYLVGMGTTCTQTSKL